jgi:uncharacterized membrane protein YeaQ/YmgE (transglycosylase-associated protein family)
VGNASFPNSTVAGAIPMKQQQWTITNYCVLILGAIYAVKLPPEPGLPHHQTYLKGLAIATAVVGSLLLLRIQSDMAKSRCRLDKLHKTYFEPDELEGIGLTEKEIENLEDETWGRYFAQWWRGFWDFTVPLIAVLAVGTVLVYFAL